MVQMRQNSLKFRERICKISLEFRDDKYVNTLDFRDNIGVLCTEKL